MCNISPCEAHFSAPLLIIIAPSLIFLLTYTSSCFIAFRIFLFFQPMKLGGERLVPDEGHLQLQSMGRGAHPAHQNLRRGQRKINKREVGSPVSHQSMGRHGYLVHRSPRRGQRKINKRKVESLVSPRYPVPGTNRSSLLRLPLGKCQLEVQLTDPFLLHQERENLPRRKIAPKVTRLKGQNQAL